MMLTINNLQKHFFILILNFIFVFENSFLISSLGNLPGFQSKGGETGR